MLHAECLVYFSGVESPSTLWPHESRFLSESLHKIRLLSTQSAIASATRVRQVNKHVQIETNVWPARFHPYKPEVL